MASIQMASYRFSLDNSSDSFSSVEMLSSSSEQQLLSLQKDIIAQSQSIEDYIKQNHGQKGTNESFSVLESLFSLFKSEVAMNLSLRKAVLSERRSRQKFESDSASISFFFQEFGRITNSNITSFEDVYNFVINKSDNYVKTKKQMKQSISEKIQQIAEIQKIVKERETEIEKYQQNEEMTSQIIEKLKTTIIALKTQVSSLKAEIAQSNEVIQKQRLAIKQQQAATDSDKENANQELAVVCEDCEQSIQKFQRKYQTEKQKSQHLVIKLKDLENRFAAKEEFYKGKINEMTEKLQTLSDSNQNVSSKVQSDMKKIDYLTAQNTDLEEQVAKMKTIIENYETELFTAKSQISNLKNSIQASKKKYEMKMNSVKLQHKHELNEVACNVECSLDQKLKVVKDKLQQKDHEIYSAKNDLDVARNQLSELVDKLKRQEKRRKKEIKGVEDLRIENERLRNMMRDKSDQQKEVESILAEFNKLQTILELGPRATPQDVVEEVLSILSSRRRHRY